MPETALLSPMHNTAEFGPSGPNIEQPLEPVPTIGEVQERLRSYAATLPERIDASPTSARSEVQAFIQDSRIGEMLEEGQYDADQLNDVLSILHGMDMNVGGLSTWRLISRANNTQAMDELSGREASSLDSILERAIATAGWRRNPAIYHDLALATTIATAGRIGDMASWRSNGQPATANKAVAALASHDQMPGAFLQIMSDGIEKEYSSEGIQQIVQMRKLERIFLEDVLGLPKDISKDIRFAIEARTTRQDENGIIPPGQGGGVDTKAWQNVMRSTKEAVQNFGVEGVRLLYDKCGLVNFDHYSTEQLRRMYLLANSNATGEERRQRDELIARLKKQDVRMVLSDAFGHRQGSIAEVTQTLETEDNAALVFEAHSAVSIYRHFAFLRSLGIKPASLAIITHGGHGYMTASKGNRRFVIMPKKPAEQSDVQIIPITSSAVGRLLEEYMQPRSDTGEREVILVSCMQAENKNRFGSNAECLAGKAEPSARVVVYAGNISLSIAKTPSGDLTFVHPETESDGTVRDAPLNPIAYRSEVYPGKKRRRRGPRTAGKIITHQTVNSIPRL